MSFILITGAGTGIGRDSAIELARRGHQVLATGEKDEDLNELRSFCKSNEIEMEFAKFDVRDENDQKIITDRQPDILISNAAIGESGPLAEIPFERVRSNFETNVFAVVRGCQLAAEYMLKKSSGRLIIIGSIGGKITMPYMGTYNMTKYALEAAADALRVETKNRGVWVSLVEPGKINTGFNQRMAATKHEWLSDKSAYADIRADLKKSDETFWEGGYTTKPVVKGIVHAVEAPNPRSRYVTPKSNTVFLWLLKFFPDRVRDYVFNKVLGL